MEVFFSNLSKIIPFAKRNNLKIIEDCAHSLGVKYKNKMLGTFGDLGCFSFEEKKALQLVTEEWS